MKVLIFSLGSRGDVQPFVALARALNDAGHEAVLSVPSNSLPLTDEYNVSSYSVAEVESAKKADYEFRLHAGEIKSTGSLKRRLALLKHRYTLSGRFVEVLDNLAKSIYHGADIVVHTPGTPAHHIAERLGVPAVVACPNACGAPTNAFPDPRFHAKVPSVFNQTTFWWSNRKIRRNQGRRVMREWRRGVLGLQDRRFHRDELRQSNGLPATFLQAVSRHMLPNVNYPSWVNTTGFWYLPSPPNWTPPDDLVDFIMVGEPPVYVGFGSMLGSNPQRNTRLVSEAIRLAGVRAVVAAGWGGIQVDDIDGEDIFTIRDIPHDWLFRRMAAIVHHGGAGTIAAALAASCPQVICTVRLDQPFNAWRMHAIGVATRPQPLCELTPESLACSIRQAVNERSMADKASEIGSRVRAERGVATAVEILESKVNA